MKKNELSEMKKMDLKGLLKRVEEIRLSLQNLHLGRNSNKISTLKDSRGLKRDLAQILTIVRQKELISELESFDKAQDKGDQNAKE